MVNIKVFNEGVFIRVEGVFWGIFDNEFLIGSS